MSRINFNNGWKFCQDYKEEMEQPGFNDAEFEEVRLYLDFISDRELSLLSEETGYEWTREELIWSDHCEMTAVCTPCIMNVAFYDSRPCCNK